MLKNLLYKIINFPKTKKEKTQWSFSNKLKMHFVSYYLFFDDSFKTHKIDLSNKVYA